MAVNWLRGLDLNQRPSGYEPELFDVICHILLILYLFLLFVFVDVFVFVSRTFGTVRSVLDVARPAIETQTYP